MPNEYMVPRQPPRSGGCVLMREALFSVASTRMLGSGARNGGFRYTRRDVAETSAAKRLLRVGMRSGGCVRARAAAVSPWCTMEMGRGGGRHCFRLRAVPMRLEWSRDAVGRATAANRQGVRMREAVVALECARARNCFKLARTPSVLNGRMGAWCGLPPPHGGFGCATRARPDFRRVSAVEFKLKLSLLI